MLYTFRDDVLGGWFGLSDDFGADQASLEQQKGLIHILWNRSAKPKSIEIDGVPYQMEGQSVTTLTYLQRFQILEGEQALTAFSFNRNFYCIVDHDEEVSCNGIIFFGSNQPIFINLPEKESRSFDLLLQVFVEEFQTNDRIQGEMLRMLLKRLIIKTTRLARNVILPEEVPVEQVDLIRRFGVLVEMHFREKKRVADYAELLYKSPKTLANLFATYDRPSPLQQIHERIVLETKRQLLYTDKSVKEIAFELGYTDPRSLQKLFKKISTQTPSQFKDSHLGPQEEK
ncbi:MAG: helix-turn-helix domain-containing protein [Bacteroidota bacterium]